MQKAHAEFCKKIQYKFKNQELLKVALTHRSTEKENNERLEFLGDSVVNFIIGEALYKKFPDAQEGELTRWRATLVRRNTLAHLGTQFDIGQYIRLGPGELKSGGHQRESILSCAMEAVIGAIYLDSGYEKCQRCVLVWYEPLIESLSDAASHKDPKSQLQEYLQRHKMDLPVYVIKSMEGEAHKQTFYIECTVDGFAKKTLGIGTSRRGAEQDAAHKMLAALRGDIKK